MTEASDLTPADAAQAWAAAFNAHDVEKLCSLYDPDAVLWGTTSPVLISSAAGVRVYFERSFGAAPDACVQLQEPLVRAFSGFAVCAGLFTLSLTIGGSKTVLPARFSFTYRRSANQWRIIEHHSSLAPPSPSPSASPSPATEKIRRKK